MSIIAGYTTFVNSDSAKTVVQAIALRFEPCLRGLGIAPQIGKMTCLIFFGQTFSNDFQRMIEQISLRHGSFKREYAL
jgi:hypothetical protein